MTIEITTQNKEAATSAQDVPHEEPRAKSLFEQLPQHNPLARTYQENPYVVLAGAVGLGYMAGRGLFTPFTRRIVKMGMRAVLVPLVITQVKAFTQPGPGPRA